MNPAYLSRLTPQVQAFVLEIELAAGIEIDVKVDTSRDGRGPEGAGILACDIDEHGATLLAPNETYFPDGGVIHEVLHVRRIFVERVPKLAANLDFAHWTPQLENGLTTLDNDLEHWVIVPEEIHRCTESGERWNRVLERTWRSDLPRMTNSDDKRRSALIHWAFLAFVLPRSSVVPIAEDVLASLALREQADNFVEVTRAHLGNKEQLVPIVLEHCKRLAKSY